MESSHQNEKKHRRLCHYITALEKSKEKRHIEKAEKTEKAENFPPFCISPHSERFADKSLPFALITAWNGGKR